MFTKQHLIDQLSHLVAFRTLSGDVSANAQALDYITTLISPQAVVERVQNGNAEIFLASNMQTTTPQIGYMVHVDVVAGSDQMFTMRQEGNLVYGRGVSDMLFSIPLGIALLNELIETQSETSFTLAITTDEEVGGFAGALHLAEKMNWRPEVLIVPDGGDNLQFVNASKGVAQFEVTSLGASAHASRPWDGKNAIVPLAKLVTALEEKYGPNSLAENWKTTLNFGQISGGISTNQVCDRAVLKLDYRYPETDSFDRIKEELLSLVEKIEPSLQVKHGLTGLPTFTDTELPVVKNFLAVFEESFGRAIPIKPTHGASDARHFAEYEIPILMIKPVGGDIHMESEWLDVESAMEFFGALRTFVGRKTV